MDKRVAETYAKASGATNKNALSDPYVKAFRWASDRIGEEGIVAFVSNNSFIESLAFDGMRKHLEQDFDEIYVLDLGGNIRKNPKLSGTTHNVFGIQVGVSINVFARLRKTSNLTKAAHIHYADVDEFWRKEEKYAYLDELQDAGQIEWQELKPDAKHNWLTEGMQDEFEAFMPIGSQKAKAGSQESAETMFKIFSGGVKTNRDAWVYNFDQPTLVDNVNRTIEAFNQEAYRWSRSRHGDEDINAFVTDDNSKVSWSETLKNHLAGGHSLRFEAANVRTAFYRPFVKRSLYFDEHLNERRYLFPSIFPTCETELENRSVWLKVGSDWPAFALMVNAIPDLLPQGGSQCFPFYTYDEDGPNRRENITDWALEQFRSHYKDKSITKWDTFHYVYALLHHPLYRERYAANLKRELPRIPYAPDFKGFAEIGKRLAEIHVNYEQQAEYPLEKLEAPGVALDWRVEKMKLSKDKRSLIYNDFLTLSGIPPKVFEYRLGNRSALDWIIDQYQVSTDKRSGITNDPNRSDDPQYVVRLIGQVITVSLETVKLVSSLGALELVSAN